MKKALITGITGQDGSYLAEFLLEKGYEVHGIVCRASSSNTARIDHLMDQILLHDGDLTDSSSLLHVISLVQPGRNSMVSGLSRNTGKLMGCLRLMALPSGGREAVWTKKATMPKLAKCLCVNPKWFRSTDVDNLWGDPTKAKTVLGWNPQKTSYTKLVELMAKHDRLLAKKEKALKEMEASA